MHTNGIKTNVMVVGALMSKNPTLAENAALLIVNILQNPDPNFVMIVRGFRVLA